MNFKIQPSEIEILAVDDDEHALFALEQALQLNGFKVSTASSGEEALSKINVSQPDLLLLDVNMPGLDGYQVTARIKADPQLKYLPIILVTAQHDLTDIVTGLESGADDYICKPFVTDELIARLKAVWRTKLLYLDLQRSNQINRELQSQLKISSSFANIIGQSALMQQLFSTIEKVASAHVSVLITGESGTGKELVARAIHYNSERADKPFIVQNCSAFNDSLLESELFGHVKGAFTGAASDKIGLFEAANGGTFFLDELGEMSPTMQAKLLRVLQDGSYLPVGATKHCSCDVRIIAATNRDLKAMIKAGTFREDLYYRINVVNLAMPPLRERRSDIPALIDFFLSQVNKRTKKQLVLSQAALIALSDYNWPGNVRELENEIERLAVMAEPEQEVPLALLSADIRENSGSTDRIPGKLKDAIENVEKDMIFAALREYNGNKSKAAEALGISRSGLIAKVQAYNLKE